MKDQLIAAAQLSVRNLEATLANLQIEEAREIQECAKTKQPIGKTYWQMRQGIEDKLRAARALLEALKC